MLVMAAVVLTALLGVAALAIDTAYLMHTRSELQSIADAAALAGASGLTISRNEARRRAIEYAAENKALGQSFTLSGSDVEIGLWNDASQTFGTSAGAPNSVRVNVTLTGSAAPQLFFGKIFGVDRSPVSARAISSLGSRNIILAFDRSNSMNDDGASPPQPLTDTKAAAAAFMDFVDSFPVVGDLAGLTLYNETAERVWFSSSRDQITSDFDEVKRHIQAIDFEPGSTGHTNIAQALRRSWDTLNNDGSNRSLWVVVLLSDGKTNTTLWGSPGNALRQNSSGEWYLPENNRAERDAYREAVRLKDRGVILYTISLGSLTNKELMQEMADITGGKHYEAPTTAQLDDIFIEISERIPVILVK